MFSKKSVLGLTFVVALPLNIMLIRKSLRSVLFAVEKIKYIKKGNTHDPIFALLL